MLLICNPNVAVAIILAFEVAYFYIWEHQEWNWERQWNNNTVHKQMQQKPVKPTIQHKQCVGWITYTLWWHWQHTSKFRGRDNEWTIYWTNEMHGKVTQVWMHRYNSRKIVQLHNASSQTAWWQNITRNPKVIWEKSRRHPSRQRITTPQSHAVRECVLRFFRSAENVFFTFFGKSKNVTFCAFLDFLRTFSRTQSPYVYVSVIT